jgi:uncharacterized protein (DUF2147 family)
MSEITQQTSTRNQLFSAYDVSKIFLANTIFRAVTIANASGSDLVLTAGMAIGAVGTTYQVYKSGTANIQLIGVCAESLTITNGNSATVNIAIGGKVAENKLTLDGTDTLATVVAYKTIRDRFASDTLGIYFAETAELTGDDNV